MPQFPLVSETCELVTRRVIDGVFYPMESVANFRLDPVLIDALTVPGGLYRDGHDVIMTPNAFARLNAAE